MKLACRVGRRSFLKMLFEDRLQLLFVDRLGQKVAGTTGESLVHVGGIRKRLPQPSASQDYCGICLSGPVPLRIANECVSYCCIISDYAL